MATDAGATASKSLTNSYGMAVLFMLGAITVLPCMNVLARYLSAEYSTTQIVWARYTGHLLFALVLFMPKHGIGLLRAQKPGVHIIRSVLMFCCTCMFFLALRYIDVPIASAINFTSPIIVTALAVPFLGEKVGVRRWVAVLIGFCGALIIIRPGGAESHWAMFLVIGTAFFYAVYQVLTRKYASSDSAETSITYIALIGALMTTVALPFDYRLPTSALDYGLFILIGFLGGLGHFLVIKAFRLGEASLLSPLNYGQLLMATLLTFLIFGTLPDAVTWLGAGIIVGSGLYITYREAQRARSNRIAAEAVAER
ncbi:DMT family transporter [Nisaea nitritireducens]|uniref:DMT family transporter n=1 Tax=Nisaea nitritireducens TaxID=568392 RepID=UPI0018670A6E|nr:DMT family transporter [Nisaea nitritireducens]